MWQACLFIRKASTNHLPAMDTEPPKRHVAQHEDFPALERQMWEEAMKTLVLRSGVKALGSLGFEASRRGLAPFLKKSGLFAFVLGLALLVGCGGGSGGIMPPPSGRNGGTGSGGTPPPPPPSGSTAVLVSLGEYTRVPDQIVSFKLTIESVALRSSKGNISLLSTPRRVELSRLKAEPLLLGNVLPQGKYSGVVIGVSNPEISFIDPSGVLHENVAASLTSSSATNPSEFSIDSTPRAIDLHLRFFEVSFDGSVVTMTPGLNFSTLGGAPTNDLVGRVTTVGSSSFTSDVGNGTFTFATDSSTEFQGLIGLSGLTARMTVEVDAVLGSGGTFRATKVKLENDVPSAQVVEGLTLSTSLAQLQMMVREVHGPGGVTPPEVGKALTVNANASTQFRLEPDDIDLSNLNFTPSFDALTIVKGQNVRAATTNGSATTITADKLKLEEQSLDGTAGTVTSGSVSGQFTFPVNLAADSAFAQLTGHTSVLVTLQPSTQKFLYFGLEDCVTCIAGGAVRVRGLLFFSGGQYRLVAEWLSVG
jgi:hypothetical protein